MKKFEGIERKETRYNELEKGCSEMEPRMVVSSEELKRTLDLPEVKEGGWSEQSLKFVLGRIKEGEREISERIGQNLAIQKIDIECNPEETSWRYLFFEYQRKKGKLLPFNKGARETRVIPRTLVINLTPRMEELKPSHPDFQDIISQTVRHELLHCLVDWPITKDSRNAVDFFRAIRRSLEKGEHKFLDGWGMDFSFLDLLPPEQRREFLGTLLLDIYEIAVSKLEEVFWPEEKKRLEKKVLEGIFRLHAQKEKEIVDERIEALITNYDIQNIPSSIKKKIEDIVLPTLSTWAFRTIVAEKGGVKELARLSRQTVEDLAAVSDIKLLKIYKRTVEELEKLYENIGLKQKEKSSKPEIGL